MLTLRPYQRDARYQLNALLNARHCPVLVMPTGTGKTKTAVSVIEDRISIRHRVFVICPQEEIFGQWEKDLAQAGMQYGTIDDRGILGRDKMVYVCMPLTLVNLLPMIPEAIYPDEIWTDEAHHSAANTWESLYAFWPDALRVGLTATPRRTDGRGLDHLYTDIAQPITMREAIDAGYLARPLCIVPKEYHLKVAIRNGDYDPAEQAALLGKPQIIGDVIGNYGDIFAGLPVLVACSTYDHAEMMTDALNTAGWRFAHIHSLLAKADRRRMLREIRTGKLNGLCTVGIGIEGMDIPGLYGLIWLRRTMSLTIFLQFIGRTLRPMEGKKYGIILDPVGNLFIHGFPDSDREWNLEGSGTSTTEDAATDLPPTMRICPACGVANAITNTACHFCGLSFSPDAMREARMRHLPAMVDGELVVVQSDGQAEALHQRSESVRTAIQAETKKETHIVPVELQKNEKASILREGLFTNRRPLFAEAVRGMK